MSMVRCENCERNIDTDVDVEHFDECKPDLTAPISMLRMAANGFDVAGRKDFGEYIDEVEKRINTELMCEADARGFEHD